MTRVTATSIAYTATQVRLSWTWRFHESHNHTDQLLCKQVRFALSSSSVFCRSDTSTDSERFYDTVLEFLDHPEEKEEVDELLNWWNWYELFNWIIPPSGCSFLCCHWYSPATLHVEVTNWRHFLSCRRSGWRSGHGWHRIC
jgi:hypothetical protein